MRRWQAFEASGMLGRMDVRARWITALGDSTTTRRRVDTLISPTVAFARAQMAAGARALGINGPQGAGKSTLAEQLVETLAWEGLRAVAISVDDFYLTNAEQRALAGAHPGSPYLEHRGYPGTHDVSLGTRTLDALLDLGEGERTRVPRYDKGAFNGRGDRAPEASWVEVEGPLDLVVLEGWMLGFAPVDEVRDPHLVAPNHALASYEAWHRRLQGLVHLDLVHLEDVVAFRVEAERRRRAAGAPGLSDAEAEDYVRRFSIAYETWVPGLRSRSPIDGPTLRLRLGSDRLPVS